MDISRAKLIYSEKVNQFYKPMRIDEDVGVVYIQPTNNRNKDVTRSQIVHMEDTDFEFVVMYDDKISAEQHFLDVLDSDCSIHVKENEVKNFKKNRLIKSNIALQKLKELSEVQSNDKLYKLAREQYCKSTNRETVIANRESYVGQDIPKEIENIAWMKRLFIERSDQYCCRPRRYPSENERRAIQARYPCGFLIRNKGGIVIVGGRYEMTISEVVEFVQNYKYKDDEYYGQMFFVPFTKEQKKQLKMCKRILERNELHIKNENNCYFWVLDKEKNVIAGSKGGFNFNGLVRFCKRLNQKVKEIRNQSVTDK